MTTQFGKILRKVRVDHDEYLKDMAEKLEVSVSFLSAIENGTKTPPNNFVDKITEAYELSGEEKQELIDCLDEYSKSVKIDLSNASDKQRKVALSFARKFDSIDKETLEKFIRLLGKD